AARARAAGRDRRDRSAWCPNCTPRPVCLSSGRPGGVPRVDGSVRTVLGDVPADWIGPTLCHEHVLLDARALTGDPDQALPDVDEQAEELRLAQRLGLSTVVDNTTPERGRDPLALKRIAAASGVQVV